MRNIIVRIKTLGLLIECLGIILIGQIRIEWIRNAKRRYSLTTDIIVGFPGETDDDFQQTLDLLDEVQYDSLFSFKYSPRPNTAALLMEDRIPDDEKQRRLLILQEKQRAIQIRRNAELIGGIQEVLAPCRVAGNPVCRPVPGLSTFTRIFLPFSSLSHVRANER